MWGLSQQDKASQESQPRVQSDRHHGSRPKRCSPCRRMRGQVQNTRRGGSVGRCSSKLTLTAGGSNCPDRDSTGGITSPRYQLGLRQSLKHEHRRLRKAKSLLSVDPARFWLTHCSAFDLRSDCDFSGNLHQAERWTPQWIFRISRCSFCFECRKEIPFYTIVSVSLKRTILASMKNLYHVHTAASDDWIDSAWNVERKRLETNA